MRPLPAKLVRLAAFAAMTVIAGGPAFSAEEKAAKDSKEVRTGKQMNVMVTQQMGVHQDLELQ